MTQTCEVPAGEVSVTIINDDRIAERIKRGQDYEPNSLAWWGDFCRVSPEPLVLDVGAYSGVFAIAAAKMGKIAHAIEAYDVMVRRLHENIALNQADIDKAGGKVIVNEWAASDRDGTGWLGINERVHLTCGGSLLRKSGARAVRTQRIDTMEFGHVAAIKIDVERAEMLVVNGALETIKRWRPNMIIECLTYQLADNSNLTSDNREAIRQLLPDYWMSDVIDRRNVVMTPA